MLLRRVIKHVRNQEWTAIGIDFLIVVIGVFVGVQVNSLWVGQADARREVAYLTALSSDFHAIIAELEGDAVHYEDIAQSMSLLLDQSQEQVPNASLAELNDAAGQLMIMKGTPIVSGTYLNLISSGDLALIQSGTLKNALASFSGHADVARLIGDTHEMQLVNIFQPYIIEHLDYTNMLIERGGLIPPTVPESDRILLALTTLELRNVAAIKWDISTDLRAFLLLALDDARDIEALLNEELEKKK